MASSLDSRAVRDAYKCRFVPRTYAEFIARHDGPLLRLQLEELHRIFHSDLPQGKTLLEVGSGPTVYCALWASYRFEDIVLSDYLEGNRRELEKWLSSSEDAIDMMFRAEQAAAMEECWDINEGAPKIIERTRRAIREVVPCDVLEPNVLPEQHQAVFDVVLSCNCLEAAAADHTSYREAVRNVGALVKPGGLLVLAGVGGMKSYLVGTETFPMANVTEDLLKRAVADAGFRTETYRSRMHDGGKTENRGKQFGFVLAARNCD